MNFSKKIFFAVLGVSILSGLATSLLLYGATASLRRQEFADHYREKIELLGDSFKVLEKASDTIAYDAARVIAERYRREHRILSNRELAALASQLGIAHIQIADREGRFIRSTGNPSTRNLFAYCPEYRELFTGKSAFQHTPLIPDENGSVYKYALMPTYDLKNAIDVNIHFDSVTKLIRSAVNADAAMDRVELFSPAGKSMGMVAKPGYLNHPMPPEEMVHGDSLLWQRDRLLISHSVPADSTHCCECQVKQLIPSGADFSYRLVAFISLGSLESSLSTLKWNFALVFLLVTAASFALASWITRLLEARKTEAQARIAAQVAHDIRSPLTSMTIALGQLQESSEAVSVLKSGVERVAGILKKLSSTYGLRPAASTPVAETAAVEAPRLTLLDKVVRDLAQEHQLRLPAGATLAMHAFSQAPSIWAVLQLTEFQSAISNILNNAFEALPGRQGRIDITIERVESQGRKARLTIRDNGIGIPAQNLGRIFERRFTSGKKNGNGLGLFQAKSAIEWCGGTIDVQSQTQGPERGTSFVITLPIEKRPSWIAASITLHPGQKIAFLDDDPSVLGLWRGRTRHLPEGTASFYTSLAEWRRSPQSSEALLVVDQYLGPESSGTTGLKLLSELAPALRQGGGLKKPAYLCTSEFDEPEIQAGVRALGAWLIPKPCIAAIEIELKTEA